MNESRRELLKYSLMAAPVLSLGFLEIATATAASQNHSEQWYWYPGHSLCIKAAGKQTGGTCMWMLVENSPHEGVPFHKHLNEDESFYVIDGEFEITVGDKTVLGGPGTYAYGPRNVPHRWTNMGSRRGRLLNVFTPAGLEEYFRSVAVPVSSSSEQPCVDMVSLAPKIAALREKFGILRTGPRKYESAVETERCSR